MRGASVRLFFSVGEPSGDLHGANLIRALRDRCPDWEYVGYGGPQMSAAGCRLHADLTKLAVMWLLRVLLNLHKFIGLLRAADRYFGEQRPDAVILIDYPGFNWWIARRAKAHGIPVIYYGTPQLWAWASYRVKRMRRDVDHVLCKLPFEETWFRNRGCHATYLGHPYFDYLAAQQLDEQFVLNMTSGADRLVTILPGSRTQEVKSNLPRFLKAAAAIAQRVTGVRFAVAAFSESQAEFARQSASKIGLPIEVHVGRTAELIRAADCCLACSGSVSLELLYHAKPSVILYHIGPISYFIQQFFRKVRYITLVNLLTASDPFTGRPAGVYDSNDPRDAHVLLPEYLACRDKSTKLADHVVQWLTDGAGYAERVRQLETLRDRVGQGGASRRAAEYIERVASTGGNAAVGSARAA